MVLDGANDPSLACCDGGPSLIDVASEAHDTLWSPSLIDDGAVGPSLIDGDAADVPECRDGSSNRVSKSQKQRVRRRVKRQAVCRAVRLLDGTSTPTTLQEAEELVDELSRLEIRLLAFRLDESSSAVA